VLFFAVVCGSLFLIGERQPSYRGKTLAQWIEPKTGPMSMGGQLTPEQETAVRAMGPRALNLLVDWLGDEPWFNPQRLFALEMHLPPSMRRLRLMPWLARKAQENELNTMSRAFAAVTALKTLGRSVRPVMPRLVQRLADRGPQGAGYRASEVLAHLGADALPDLIELLSDHGFTNRLAAVEVISHMNMYGLGPECARAVPIVIDCLHADGSNLRRACVEALLVLPGHAELKVPALTEALTNAEVASDVVLARKCIEVLSQSGPAAASTVPLLCGLLNSADGITSEEAARALGKIGANRPIAVPALTAYFRGNDKRHRKYAMEGLAGFGAPSPDVIPLLKEALSDEDHDTRSLAASLLNRVADAQ
jgi:HEAT repeat protein